MIPQANPSIKPKITNGPCFAFSKCSFYFISLEFLPNYCCITQFYAFNPFVNFLLCREQSDAVEIIVWAPRVLYTHGHKCSHQNNPGDVIVRIVRIARSATYMLIYNISCEKKIHLSLLKYCIFVAKFPIYTYIISVFCNCFM